jgi:hypothetical protein
VARAAGRADTACWVLFSLGLLAAWAVVAARTVRSELFAPWR